MFGMVPPWMRGRGRVARGTRSHSGTRRKPLIARSRQREPPFKLIKIGESPPSPAGGPTFERGDQCLSTSVLGSCATGISNGLHFVPIPALPRGHHWEAVTPRGQGMEPRNRFLPRGVVCLSPISAFEHTHTLLGCYANWTSAGASGEVSRNDPQVRSSEQSAKLSIGGRRRRRRRGSRTFASLLRVLGRSSFVSLSHT